MFSKIYDMLVSFLGESKQGGYSNDISQYQFNCPSCAEEKGETDGKYNLEISFTIGKCHCWACDFKGNISYLIKKYGNKTLLKEYEDEVKSIRESKLYDIDEYKDFFENTKKESDRLKLPQTFTNIDLKNLKSKKLREYLQKRNISQEIIDKHNLGFTKWEEPDWKMRNRLIIPSYDEDGILNYWVGRDFSNYEKAIKYKNCDADKKEIVFQENLINWDGMIVLVEGAIDCIYYPNSIALLGKFLTRDSEIYHKLYEKANGEIVICLDADTNINETKKIYSLLNIGRLRNKIRYVRLDKYKDFGEAYEAEGKKGIIDILKTSKQFHEIELLM